MVWHHALAWPRLRITLTEKGEYAGGKHVVNLVAVNALMLFNQLIEVIHLSRNAKVKLDTAEAGADVSLREGEDTRQTCVFLNSCFAEEDDDLPLVVYIHCKLAELSAHEREKDELNYVSLMVGADRNGLLTYQARSQYLKFQLCRKICS